jgi:subtilisin family serine protease
MRALSRLLLVFFALLFVSSSAFAQTLREFILVIGEDDQLDEPSLRLALSLADATAERVVDGPAASASPVLNGAYVVTVPAHKAVTLVELLSLDVENVALIEDNVRVFAPPSVEDGPCQGRGGLTAVNDPLAQAQLEMAEDGADTVLRSLAGALQYATPQTVAVIDTGVNGLHEDLYGLVFPAADNDSDGHGTAVAGRIAANTNNGVGLASLNHSGAYLWVRSYPALAEKNASADDIARAIVTATNDGVAVINMSFGGQGKAPTIVVEAIKYAVAQDVMLVAAAGNDGLFRDAVTRWPANVPGVLAISVASRDGVQPEYASHLTDLPLGAWASGDGVCVLDNQDGYRRDSGSSFAAASVSGLLGVARALCPGLSSTAAYELLRRSGVPMEEGGYIIIDDTFFMALDANAQKVCSSP